MGTQLDTDRFSVDGAWLRADRLAAGRLGSGVGVYGVSFMLLLSAAAIIATFMARPLEAASSALSAIVLPWVIGGVLTFVDWTEPDGKALRASILQAGVSQDKKWDRDQLLPIMEYYHSATLSAADSDIVLWPEVAIPALNDQVESFIARVESDARDERAERPVWHSRTQLRAQRRRAHLQQRHADRR